MRKTVTKNARGALFWFVQMCLMVVMERCSWESSVQTCFYFFWRRRSKLKRIGVVSLGGMKQIVVAAMN